VLAAVWSVVIGSRGQVGHVGAAPHRWGLATGEVDDDGHQPAWQGSMTCGATSSEKEREGRGVLGRPDWLGRARGEAGRGGVKGESRALGGPRGLVGPSKGKEGE
jgi:hypothetical protein